MYENLYENRQILAKCLPFFKISLIYASKWPLFLDFAPTVEKLPLFFAKVGTSVVYVLIGSGGGGGGFKQGQSWYISHKDEYKFSQLRQTRALIQYKDTVLSVQKIPLWR